MAYVYYLNVRNQQIIGPSNAQTRCHPRSSESCSQRPQRIHHPPLSFFLPTSTLLLFHPTPPSRIMLSRFAPRAFTAAPLRCPAPVRAALRPAVVRRSVTTDAASSHAEKDDVPAVRFSNLCAPSCVLSEKNYPD